MRKMAKSVLKLAKSVVFIFRHSGGKYSKLVKDVTLVGNVSDCRHIIVSFCYASINLFPTRFIIITHGPKLVMNTSTTLITNNPLRIVICIFVLARASLRPILVSGTILASKYHYYSFHSSITQV